MILKGSRSMKKNDMPPTIVRMTRRGARAAGPDAFEALILAMEALPAYRNWLFLCEFPGLFCFRHPDNRFSVFCTPDWGADETLPIHVHLDDGTLLEDEGLNQQLPLPREGRTAEKILELVRPTLDKLLTMPGFPRTATSASAPPSRDVLHLSVRQVEALREAREYVRVHMAHEHGWTVRDEALDAIDRALQSLAGTPILTAVSPPDVLFLGSRHVAALKKAREYVRVHMTEHGWSTRDEALAALDQALVAVREVSS